MQLVAPRNNYTSNIKDPWSKATMTSAINESLKYKKNCKNVKPAQNEQMLLKNGVHRHLLNAGSPQTFTLWEMQCLRSETMWGLPVLIWWKGSCNQVGDVFDVAIRARHMKYETVGPLFLPRFTWCWELSDSELMGYVGNTANYRLDVCGICEGNGAEQSCIHTWNIRCNLNGLM